MRNNEVQDTRGVNGGTTLPKRRWSDMPLAREWDRELVFVSDIGNNGSVWHSLYGSWKLSNVMIPDFSAIPTSPTPADFGICNITVNGVPYSCDGVNFTKTLTAVTTKNTSDLLLYRLRTTIVTNGGSVNDKDLQALKVPLDILMQTSAFKKLVELWMPVGDGYLSAMCKLIGQSTLVMTGNNLVDADYSRYLGVKGNGSTKDIATGFTPTSLTSSWGFAVQPTGITAQASTRILCGSGNNTWLGFSSGNGSAKINNAPEIGLGVPLGRMLAVQNDSVAGCSAWYGGYKNATDVAGSTASNQLRLLSYAGSLYSDVSIGGFAAWAGNLTTQELQYLQNFFNSASSALNMLSKTPSITFCGDSLTAGYGLSNPTTERFSVLLSNYFGAIEDNQGWSGSVMSSYTPGGSTGSWYTSRKVSSTNRNSTYLVVMLGYNDSRSGGDVNLFTTEYTQWLNYQIDMGGIDRNNILLIAPPTNPEPLAGQTSILQFRDAVKNIATAYKTKYLDAYALTINHPEYFQSDKTHLNTTGNIVIFNAMVDVFLQN